MADTTQARSCLVELRDTPSTVLLNGKVVVITLSVLEGGGDNAEVALLQTQTAARQNSH